MRSFNPRARVGRDPAGKCQALAGEFQSARPRGARHFAGGNALGEDVSIRAPAWGATPLPSIPRTRHCFNPRARVGRDIWMPLPGFFPGVSIRAPAWGATSLGAGALRIACFNPRARVGRDGL